MKTKLGRARKPALIRNAELAMKQAVAEVMREHRKHGFPIAIWRDGKVKWVKLPRKNGVRKSSTRNTR
jgi:hypothetical protein